MVRTRKGSLDDPTLAGDALYVDAPTRCGQRLTDLLVAPVQPARNKLTDLSGKLTDKQVLERI